MEKKACRSEGLSEIIENFLEKYFSIYGEDVPADGLYGRIMAEVEKPLLCAALKAVDENQVKAAKLLGMNRNTLRKKMKELGLKKSKV